MAFASLFTLLDDIASVLDDVSLMTKMAAKKTVGVVGDDLALNANQVTGVSADRELPIVWQVAKGSLANKLILIPATLLLGGAYLCFEGVEKLLHPLLHRHKTGHSPEAVPDELPDENAKIKGAIRTDFILSAEIIIISMGAVNANSGMLQQALMLSVIGIGMTIFVYGLVAMIVKLDDLGLFLIRRGGVWKSMGNALLAVMPVFMRGLSVVGTLAMFLVGGGIIAHGAPSVSDFLHTMHWEGGIMGNLANLIVGLLSGSIVCAVVLPLIKLFGKKH